MSGRPCLVCEGWGAYCDKHKPRAASPSGPSPDRMPVHDNGMDQADDLDEALATARQQGREEAVREIRAKVLALHPVTPAELFGILDAIAEGTAPDWKEAAVRGYRQGWADAIAGDGGDRP